MSRRCFASVARKLALEVVGGYLICVVKPAHRLVLLFGDTALLQPYAGAFGKQPQGVAEVEAIVLHHEGDHVAAGAARAEAMPRLPVW